MECMCAVKDEINVPIEKSFRVKFFRSVVLSICGLGVGVGGGLGGGCLQRGESRRQ